MCGKQISAMSEKLEGLWEAAGHQSLVARSLGVGKVEVSIFLWLGVDFVPWYIPRYRYLYCYHL